MTSASVMKDLCSVNLPDVKIQLFLSVKWEARSTLLYLSLTEILLNSCILKILN